MKDITALNLSKLVFNIKLLSTVEHTPNKALGENGYLIIFGYL
jgi:hypothetical protein